jgi:dTDP-4-dehydrorhamnose reductase
VKILITGAGGQLGHDLIRVLSPLHETIPLSRKQLDVTDELAVKQQIAAQHPDAVIHAAAFTGVDLAETLLDTAYAINSTGTRNVALAAQKAAAKLIYISTDYVFDGTKAGSYTELDRTNPLSVYGNSKLHGEKFVEMICQQYFIVRTSWLYGKHGDNFVTKVLALAERQSLLTMVSDQIGSPTYTLDLARFVGELVETDKFGLYHASNQGCCTRYEFAQAILQAVNRRDVKLEPVSASAFSLLAPRPDNSAFDDLAIRQNGLSRMRDWKSGLHDFIRNDLQFVNPDEGGRL